MTDEPRPRRFLITQAAEELNVNQNQIRALLRTGELRGIQVGGRGYLGHSCGLERSPLTLQGSWPEISVRFVRNVGAAWVLCGA